MAKFYGTLKGCRGEATRCGGECSGIKASVQSYDGSIITRLDYNQEGELIVTVNYSEDSSSCGNRLFVGTFEEFVNKLRRERNER